MNKNRSHSTIVDEKLGKAFTMQSRKREQIKEIFGLKKSQVNKHWALKDINFELYKSESIGIVGKNGSGKSTLLQLICGTLTATEGKVITNGKIAALLELGSGFNPEFTGIENVYLNATLMGLKKKEIEDNLDKILSFADIGNFIDQPIRTYSSGMIVRLAFAVIAHVNADILVVDEALAVGDAYFTQKCMRFIQRVREEKSLIFVSHDANAVLNLCSKAILLEKGTMRAYGSPKAVMEEYTKGLQKEMGLEKGNETSTKNNKQNSGLKIKEFWTLEEKEFYKMKWQDYRTEYRNKTEMANKIAIKKFDMIELISEDYGGEVASIEEVSLTNIETTQNINVIMGGELVKLTITIKTNGHIANPIVGFLLKNDNGITLLGENSYNKLTKEKIKNLVEDMTIVVNFEFTIPILPNGNYSISISIADGDQTEHKILHWKNDAIILQSQCSSVAAGLAGVPMHSIKMETI